MDYAKILLTFLQVYVQRFHKQYLHEFHKEYPHKFLKKFLQLVLLVWFLKNFSPNEWKLHMNSPEISQDNYLKIAPARTSSKDYLSNSTRNSSYTFRFLHNCRKGFLPRFHLRILPEVVSIFLQRIIQDFFRGFICYINRKFP